MTANFKKETMKVESGAVALLLVDLFIDDVTLRLVANVEEIVSNTETYLPYSLTFTPPAEGTKAVTATINIEDVFRAITSELEDVSTTDISMSLYVVLASDPDVIEKDFGLFDVDAYTISGKNVSMTISKKNILRNSLSSHVITPADFQGLFLL